MDQAETGFDGHEKYELQSQPSRTSFPEVTEKSVEVKKQDVDTISESDMVSWEPYGKMTKAAFSKRVWRNIITLSIAFMLNYISYGGLSALQSSLHVQDGMGTICTSIRYVTLVISCIFVPSLMIRAITHKHTITVSFIGFIIWMIANGYGVWATMVPASIINGFFVAPLWAAQGAYFTELAREYARLNNENEATRIALFFGVYYMFYTGSGVFGNIISSTVLRTGPADNTTYTPSNEEIAENCGMNDCPWQSLNGTAAEEVPAVTVWTLVGIYIIIATGAILITIFLVDHLPRHLVKDTGLTVRQEFKTLVTSTMRQTIKKTQLLLIPITLYMGIEESFFGAEYNRSWVTCALGIDKIGLTNIPYGLTGAIVSFSGGRLVKVVGRWPIFLAGLCLDLINQLFLTFWVVNPDQVGLFYMIPVFWGASDAIWITLVGALYGTFFGDNTEAAFSNYMLWWCAGLAIGFGYSQALCTSTKMYILFSTLWIGIICYFGAEFVYKKEQLKIHVVTVEENDLERSSDSVMKKTIPVDDIVNDSETKSTTNQEEPRKINESALDTDDHKI